MDRLHQCILALFEADQLDAVLAELERLPADVQGDMLRLQLAAVRLSGGSLPRLIEAVDLGRKDFRDLLMGAGFGDLGTHLHWVPRRFGPEVVERWESGEPIESVYYRPGEAVGKLTAVLNATSPRG